MPRGAFPLNLVFAVPRERTQQAALPTHPGFKHSETLRILSSRERRHFPRVISITETGCHLEARCKKRVRKREFSLRISQSLRKAFLLTVNINKGNSTVVCITHKIAIFIFLVVLI